MIKMCSIPQQRRIALTTQRAGIGNRSHSGILEVSVDWQEGKDLRMSPEEEEAFAEEAPPYKKQKMRSDMPCLLMGPVTL